MDHKAQQYEEELAALTRPNMPAPTGFTKQQAQDLVAGFRDGLRTGITAAFALAGVKLEG